MKKGIFYIASLTITLLIALSAKAGAFSSTTNESGPEIKTIRIAKIENENKRDNLEISENYREIIRNNNPTPSITSNIEEIPTFKVTDYISVCDNVHCFTSKDAERGVVQFQDTFFYGHSTVAFDRLKTVYVGNKIKVIDINGRARTYIVRERLVKEKSYLNGEGKSDGFTAGIYSANYYGTNYSAAFMTCGNGSNDDSNYRLILFAEEI